VTWTAYFTLIKVLPGRIVTPRFGTLDFSDPKLPVEKVKALFDDGFPYLELTTLGLQKFPNEISQPQSDPVPGTDQAEQPVKTTRKRKT